MSTSNNKRIFKLKYMYDSVIFNGQFLKTVITGLSCSYENPFNCTFIILQAFVFKSNLFS